MSDCDDQKNKPIDDGSTVDAKKTYCRWADHNHRSRHDCRNIFWSKTGRHEAS